MTQPLDTSNLVTARITVVATLTKLRNIACDSVDVAIADDDAETVERLTMVLTGLHHALHNMQTLTARNLRNANLLDPAKMDNYL